MPDQEEQRIILLDRIELVECGRSKKGERGEEVNQRENEPRNGVHHATRLEPMVGLASRLPRDFDLSHRQISSLNVDLPIPAEGITVHHFNPLGKQGIANCVGRGEILCSPSLFAAGEVMINLFGRDLRIGRLHAQVGAVDAQ